MIDFNFAEADILYKKYSKCLKENPNNIDALITLGFLEANYHSNYTESRNLFEKVIEINSEEIDAYLGLSTIIFLNSEFKNFKKASNYLSLCLN